MVQDVSYWEKPYPNFIKQSGGELRWLKYHSSSEQFCTSTFRGSYHLLAVLVLSDIVIKNDDTMPMFPSLQDLTLTRMQLPGGVQRVLDLIGNSPVLESLSIHHVFGDEEYNLDGGPTETVTLMSRLHLRKLLVRSRIYFACVFLRSVPDPSHTFILELTDVDPVENEFGRYSEYYNEVFGRVSNYWMRKTGQQYLTRGTFLLCWSLINSRVQKSYVQLESPSGSCGTPVVFFRAEADLDLASSFWPHVTTLYLGPFITVDKDYLLGGLENFYRLSRLHSITVDIEVKNTCGVGFVRRWLSDNVLTRQCSVKEIIFTDSDDIFKDLCEELKYSTSGIQVLWGEDWEAPWEHSLSRMKYH
jgi:hypothetical protein